MEKIICVLIGYLFGCVLFGEIIAHLFAHKSASEIGVSGNPGMANIMDNLGFIPGLLVLIGDLLKTIMAMLIAYYLYHGHIYMLYALLGATLGHCFPFWRKFKGGKGVACTCAGILFYSPVYGLLCILIGALAVIISTYLSFGGVMIVFAFMIVAYFKYGLEAFLVSLAIFIVCFVRHYPKLSSFPAGNGKPLKIFRRQK